MFISQYAAIMTGGIACSINPTSSVETVQHIINSAKCLIVIVEDDVQLQKILTNVNKLPSVKVIIQYKGEPSNPNVMSWEDLMAVGNEEKKKFDIQLKQRIDSLQSNKCCVVVHASEDADTEKPKGAMFSHDNVTWTANAITRTGNLVIDKEIFVSYQPLGCSFVNQLWDSFLAGFCGATVYFADSDDTLKTLKEIHPSQFYGLPSVWKMLNDAIERTPKVGRYNKLRRQYGLDKRPQLFAGYGIDREMLSPVKSLNVSVNELYGKTECTGVHALNVRSSCRDGSVGKNLPGVKTVLVLDKNSGFKEVFLNGRHVFMGYLNMPEETNKIVDSDGWLRTGDVGHQDKEGFLYIDERTKENRVLKTQTIEGDRSLLTILRDGEVDLRLADSGPGSEKPMTVIECLEQTTKRVPEQVALAEKIRERWTGYTYNWYYDRVRCAARAFMQMGLQASGSVALMGFNSVEWLIAHYAAIMAGGISCGIYTNYTPEDCQHVINNAKCQIVVVDDDEQLQKILSIIENLPTVKMVVQYTGKPIDSRVMSWEDLMTLGDEDKDENDEELDQRISALQSNKCCVIVHTPGITGNPKGVMLSHDNITWTANTIMKTANFITDNEVFVSYLPLCNISVQMFDIFIPVTCGGTVYFAQPDALTTSLRRTFKEVLPTQLIGLPAVWKYFQADIEKSIADGNDINGDMVDWAKKLSVKSHAASNRGEPKYAGFSIARKLVYSKVRHHYGLDKCKQLFAVGGPLERNTLDLFLGLDLPLLELYGSAECTGVHTMNVQGNCQIGSVGRENPGVKTSFLLDRKTGLQEMRISGRHVFMGYVNLRDETIAAVDKNGWLLTGDAGYKANDGFIYITGRIAELITTDNGEYISPLKIENRVKAVLPCISNCMLVGDRRKFLSMLLTMKTEINPDTLEPTEKLAQPAIDWCRSVGCYASTLSDLLEAADMQVLGAIERGISEVNKDAKSDAQKILRWTVLLQDFSVVGGEIAPNLKLRRQYIENSYKETIEAFYEEDITNESTNNNDNEVSNKPAIKTIRDITTITV